MPHIEVSQFNTDFLENVVCAVTNSPLRSSTSRKDHVVYLSDYLENINVKTVVLEGSYIDKNYLEDYQKYYSSCFPNHSKCCTRLHFFANVFDESEFLNIIEIPDIDKNNNNGVDFLSLEENYLGYIVIRPIPETFIARLCLKAYDGINVNTEQYFLIQDEHKVRLFGMTLSIKGVPFTEKDRVVSACATSSIWVMLNASPHYEKKTPPSPGDITKAALNLKTLDSNSFSILGLEPSEVHRTIHHYGLLARDVALPKNDLDENYSTLKRYAAAFLTDGIPFILAGTVYRTHKLNIDEQSGLPEVDVLGEGRVLVDDMQLQPIGEHAICVLGYRKGAETSSSDVSNDIETLYAHDDRYGPYLALKFSQDAYRVDDKVVLERRRKSRAVSGLKISFDKLNDDGCELYEVFVPDRIFIAKHQQVRTSYEDVHPLVDVFFDICWMLHYASKDKHNTLTNFLEGLRYNIYLSNSCNFKEEVRRRKKSYFCFNAEENKLTAFINRPLPEHIWVASIYKDSDVVGELIFDATEIIQGRPVIGYISYSKEFNLIWFLLSKEDVYTSLSDIIALAVDNKDIEVSYLNRLNLYLKFIHESSRLFLNLLYGQAKIIYRPFRTQTHRSKAEIQGSLGKIYRKPEVKIIKFESSWKSTVLDKTKKYIWLVNEDGDFYYGIEDDAPDSIYNTGHTTLNDGKPARVAGELSYDMKVKNWSINLNSGAYSRHIVGHSSQQKYLKSVIDFNFKGWKIKPKISIKK